jgi:hypothetical protein
VGATGIKEERKRRRRCTLKPFFIRQIYINFIRAKAYYFSSHIAFPRSSKTNDFLVIYTSDSIFSIVSFQWSEYFRI